MHSAQLKLLPLLGLLLWAVPASAITYSGHKASNSNAGAGQAVTSTITSQTSGNTNIITIFWCNGSSCAVDCTPDTVAIADTSLNTYVLDLRLNASVNRPQCMAIYHASNIATQASNAVVTTITSGGTTNFLASLVSEWNGLAASPKDQTGTVDLASSASPLSVTAGGGTSQASELVYAFGLINGGTLAAGASYTGLNAPSTNELDEYQIVSSIATYTATETFGANSGKGGVLVTFKGTAAGAAASTIAGPSKVVGPSKVD